ncbi:hypothetical protein EAO70_17875 [Streptomyces sp. adm13(2018)]|nr:hypothetical protein EAO70_17875 [Streptomyces sp. adm13(2018)]
MPGLSTVPSSEALSPSAGPADRPTAISSDVWLVTNLHRTAGRATVRGGRPGLIATPYMRARPPGPGGLGGLGGRCPGPVTDGAPRGAKAPELPVVLLEDLGALVGLVLALGGWPVPADGRCRTGVSCRCRPGSSPGRCGPARASARRTRRAPGR